MAAERTPERADEDRALIERVVDVAGYLADVHPAKTGNAGFRIWSTRTRQQRQNTKGIFELGYEDVRVDPMLKPPFLLTEDMLMGRRCEPDPTRPQRDRRSRRICAASTRRPAATSALDARRAS